MKSKQKTIENMSETNFWFFERSLKIGKPSSNPDTENQDQE